MQRVIFAVSPFTQEYEILGVDGEIYRIKPNEVIILPKFNAEVFEKNNVGRIVGIYRDPGFDWEREVLNRIVGEETEFYEEDPVREWAKESLKIEHSKPNPDPDRIIQLRMIIKGLNPAQFYKSHENKNTPLHHQTHSAEPSPTGLSRHIYNTAQPHNSDSFIKEDDEINSNWLRTVFETYGLRLVTTLQAYRVAGLDEIGINGYAVLDYGYTRVEPHEEFVRLLKHLGYGENDVYARVLFDHYRCERHGDVFKPALDFAKGGYWDGGERKQSYRLMAGRLHPLKKHSDTKRYSALKLEQFNAIADSVRGKGVISFRKFDDVLSEVKQEKRDLALIWMVFTVPDIISEYLVKEDVSKAKEIMKKAARSALRRFLRKYLRKHENVPYNGDFKEGGVMNVHIWSSSQPIKPHLHVHIALWNFVVWNGKYVRFSPYFPKEWMAELRGLWKREFFRYLRKAGFGMYLDMEYCNVLDDTYEFFNIYTQYNWFKDENFGKILHHLRYNARKAVIDINEFFYSGVGFDDLTDEQKEWLGFLIQYSNRTGNFGFMNNWRIVFSVSKDRVIEFLERLRTEHYEYCPICKRKLEKVGVVTIDEIAKRRRLLVLWWFDRRMNVEMWRAP